MTAKMERRGRRFLEAPDTRTLPARPYFVRLWYLSEGGEVLCCDTDAVSRQAAESLVAEYRRPDHDAIHVAHYRLGEEAPEIPNPDLAAARYAEQKARDKEREMFRRPAESLRSWNNRLERMQRHVEELAERRKALEAKTLPRFVRFPSQTAFLLDVNA
jgi:hypothetical protein